VLLQGPDAFVARLPGPDIMPTSVAHFNESEPSTK
jgi:hypothetical protein